MTIQTAQPMKGTLLGEVKTFLSANSLSYEGDPSFTCLLRDDSDRIIGTGSLEGNVLKYIAIEKNHQGEGLLSQLMTSLVTQAFFEGYTHLFIFTKPKNKALFSPFGFFPIEETEQVLLMENRKDGILQYINSLERETEELVRGRGLSKIGDIGVIVVNCNPFTKGHRYLIAYAAQKCALLHVFVVSSDKSVFPSSVRFDLVKKGTEDLSNVLVHEASDYLVSSATFPSYFLKETNKAGFVNCQLDIGIFLHYIVPALGITRRFVGTEPLCRTTEAYNRQMELMLGAKGVGFEEVARKQESEVPISASLVRRLMAQKRFEDIKPLVPETTYDFIMSQQGQAIADQLKMERV
ncbi:(citrate (pro-3S)-lyase) ligase [Sphaerochaeta pleomorpha str. Grapes]|uniref:[Citrate [pro-3S]-lyase] ligase n=1 Tax=Sphaerochaeta pleomorpha (strain ATCC BAA-1885 / DSM 22778 / Grapes) TaxID=158190 RepID=G8QUK7_SPHPG|nr:[citrate (pro-3S)-lyase] ligase [Sphaerochaeta pleomorpha]AEV30315.1 (citrate (pro-3S)-lyase) ligase [Sphaerochaeta pleomorpha str. Grapes]